MTWRPGGMIDEVPGRLRISVPADPEVTHFQSHFSALLRKRPTRVFSDRSRTTLHTEGHVVHRVRYMHAVGWA